MDDKLAWHSEKIGCFTVRSAYRLGMQICDLEHGMQGSSSRPDGARMIWNKFWALPIPQKVKIFAWRLIHKGLPQGIINMLVDSKNKIFVRCAVWRWRMNIMQ